MPRGKTRRTKWARRLCWPVATAALLLIGPSAAQAAFTCNFAMGTATVAITDTSDFTLIERSGTEIVIDPDGNGPQAAVSCSGGPATVSNTDTIVVTSAVRPSFGISLVDGPFEPGATAEPATSEIEFHVELGPGPGVSRLQMFGVSTVRMGANGINLNAAAEAAGAGADADVTDNSGNSAPLNVVTYDPFGGAGDDELSAVGGLGTGGPVPSTVFLQLVGSNGNDTLVGGLADDRLFANADDDALEGGEGDDEMWGGIGTDLLRGGLGGDMIDGGILLTPEADEGDTLAYDGVPGAGSGVSVNLATSSVSGGQGADTIQDVRDVIGSPLADTITGNTLGNQISGGSGNDTVDGGAGEDQLTGDAGADSLLGSAGADELGGGSDADTIDGGSENDALRGDAGPDRLLGGPADDLVFGGAGKDRLLGNGGIDRLFAKDRTRDRRINCGPGANRRERARVDRRGPRRKRDPRPMSC